MKTCQFCGKPLVGQQQKFCSRSCHNKGQPRQFKELPHIPKVCAICGKSFLATRCDRKYCSNTCRERQRQLRRPRKPKADQTLWRKRRHEIWEKQHGLCWLCEKPMERDEGFNVHHLTGDHDPRSNDVVALHRACHTQFHKVSLIVENSVIRFESPIIEQVSRKLRINKE